MTLYGNLNYKPSVLAQKLVQGLPFPTFNKFAANNFWIILRRKYYYWKELKTLWQIEKLLILNNFSFCQNVFKSHLLQSLQKASVCGEGFKHHCLCCCEAQCDFLYPFPHRKSKSAADKFENTFSNTCKISTNESWKEMKIFWQKRRNCSLWAILPFCHNVFRNLLIKLQSKIICVWERIDYIFKFWSEVDSALDIFRFAFWWELRRQYTNCLIDKLQL